MSLPRATTVGNNSPNNSTLQQQLMNNEGGIAAAPTSSSSWNRVTNNNNIRNSVNPIPPQKRSKLDSDEDLFTVPDVETMLSVHSSATNTNSGNVDQSNAIDSQLQAAVAGKRRRGRNPVDKEYRRLKSPTRDSGPAMDHRPIRLLNPDREVTCASPHTLLRRLGQLTEASKHMDPSERTHRVSEVASPANQRKIQTKVCLSRSLHPKLDPPSHPVAPTSTPPEPPFTRVTEHWRCLWRAGVNMELFPRREEIREEGGACLRSRVSSATSSQVFSRPLSRQDDALSISREMPVWWHR
ncbi:uncharacterized protein LOC107484362 isoform X2 [Arachis duranensis]|uniref:Uncharacterized protein LOC107484362 isoform X2 n=1 Tax=Arachis duranensis TaxID=130453 RepID=A0A9C6TW87_ARADU|nr:uncharacterized protein LOC112796739 isoform X2 [Arachis hypogaea]XP_052115784.1 uncharacterized protein LOC107484362 isoform X2 [Arachis duranensis]